VPPAPFALHRARLAPRGALGGGAPTLGALGAV
jgi:hypothetical protein